MSEDNFFLDVLDRTSDRTGTRVPSEDLINEIASPLPGHMSRIKHEIRFFTLLADAISPEALFTSKNVHGVFYLWSDKTMKLSIASDKSGQMSLLVP